MASPIQHLVAVGPRASIAVGPRAVATQVIALIVLSITAILAVVPSALGMVIGCNLLILGRLGIG